MDSVRTSTCIDDLDGPDMRNLSLPNPIDYNLEPERSWINNKNTYTS